MQRPTTGMLIIIIAYNNNNNNKTAGNAANVGTLNDRIAAADG